MTATTVYPPTKAELLALIAAAHAELEQTLIGLSPAEISAGSDLLDWSVKDHLAHLSAWAAGVAAMLQYQPRWRAMQLSDDFVARASEDDINAFLYHQHQDRSLTDVRSYFASAHQSLVDLIQRLDYADLQRPYSHYQPDDTGNDDGRPMLWWVVHNTYLHYRMHQPWIAEKIKRIRA